MKKDTILFLKIVTNIMGIVTLALFVFYLPWLANRTATNHPKFAHLKSPMLIGLYIKGIPFYLALYKAFMLLNYIKNGNAFSIDSVDALSYIKKYATSEIVIYLAIFSYLMIQKALHPGIIIIIGVITFTALTISFFAAILQELLNTALKIKSENDITI